jgi:hypothetical protein
VINKSKYPLIKVLVPIYLIKEFVYVKITTGIICKKTETRILYG